MIKWSDEQYQAITSNGTNELLNAGAGSGKTAVLSEHVIFLLQHGYSLDDLLIMTFTDPAAKEMKQRIKSKIEDIPDLNEKYSEEIEAAHISTFDSFYLYLVKKYHYKLNLDEGIKILDGTIENVLSSRITTSLLNEYYESHNPVFEDMVKQYCVKKDDIIYDAINAILKKANLVINKEEFFNNYLDSYFSDSFIESIISKHFIRCKETISQLANAADNLECDKDRESLLKFFDELNSSQNYDEFLYKVQNNKFPAKKRSDATDGQYRDNIAKVYKKTFIEGNVDFGNSDDVKTTQLAIKPYIELLFKISKEVDERMWAFKCKYNSFTFADIAALALKLLNDKQILDEVKTRFKYILIDEYQDTNDLQEAVILKLANDNVFMVGDVKQSIYRFRNANCLIFQNKYNNYKHGGNGGHVIDMTQNFRSRHELIDDFNSYFGQLMTLKTNLIDYSDGHITKFGFKDYDDAVSPNMNNGIHFYKYSASALKGEIKYSASEYEARIIANDIIKKINEGYPVYDKNSANKLRPCKFKDFAIIIDRGTHFDQYKRIFGEYLIPLYVLNDEDVHKNTIFLIGPNLLKVYQGVKNHTYDSFFAHAFASICRSFIVQRSDEEIYHTIKNSSYDSDEVVLMFKDIINEHGEEPISNIFKAILDKFDIYNKLESIGDYTNNSSDIQKLLSLIEGMDDFDFTLEQVIDYFNDLDDIEAEIKSSPVKDSENSVILLNIHKSKGLEFPIVYYAGMTVAFNRKDLSSSVVIDNKYGPILPTNAHSNTQLTRQLFINEEIQQDYEEKLRLFYVAVTRAKESAIIIDQYQDKEPDFFDPCLAKSFHDMFLSLRIANDRIHDLDNISFSNELININNESKTAEPFVLKELPQIKFEEINKTRASKVATSDVNQDALDFGNKMHLLLELVDMNSKDLSYIQDVHEKRYVENVINLDIFKGIDNDHIRHEFAFFDDESNLLGIIDCLLIKDNEVDIIDFKLKNVSDEAYQKQLQAYYDYVKKITDKPIKTFLISIIDAKVEEVKMNG